MQDNDKPVLSLISSHFEKTYLCPLSQSFMTIIDKIFDYKNYWLSKTNDNNIHQFFWLVYAFCSLIHSIVAVSFQAISLCLETNISGCVLSHARILNHFVLGVDLLLLLLFLLSSQTSTKTTINAAGNQQERKDKSENQGDFITNVPILWT